MKSKKKNDIAVVFGADGLLGKEFISLFGELSGFEMRAYDKKTADITDSGAVFGIISKEQPKVVINCAVAVNVDYCEENPLSAWNVNALGAGIIADSIKQSDLPNTVFVQISTSDVFSGRKKKYTANDVPDPINVYGWSKYGGEKIIEQIGASLPGRFFIVRNGWLYGTGRDTFVDMVVQTLRQKKSIEAISDQYNFPIWTKEVVKAVWKLIGGKTNHPSGIYQIGAPEGEMGVTKYDIAMETARILKLDSSLIKKCSYTDTLRVPRPKSPVLSHSPAFQKISWKKSLSEYLLSRYSRN